MNHSSKRNDFVGSCATRCFLFAAAIASTWIGRFLGLFLAQTLGSLAATFPGNGLSRTAVLLVVLPMISILICTTKRARVPMLCNRLLFLPFGHHTKWFAFHSLFFALAGFRLFDSSGGVCTPAIF